MEVNKKSLKAAIIGILISLASILVIFELTKTAVTWEMIHHLDWRFFSLAFILQFFYWFFWALRLKFLAFLLNTTLSLRFALETTIACTFFAAITPSSVGGEPMRVKMVAERMSIGSASAVVLAERLFDAIFLIPALSFFLVVSGFAMKLGATVGLSFFIFLFFSLVFLYYTFKTPENTDKFAVKLDRFLRRFISERRAEKVSETVRRELVGFRDAAVDLRKRSPSQMAIVMLVTALMWFSAFLIPSMILIALRLEPAFLLSLTSQFILVIVTLVPLTPGASGIAEAGMVSLYSHFVPLPALGLLVALWRVITYYMNLIAGLLVIIFLLRFRYLRKNHQG